MREDEGAHGGASAREGTQKRVRARRTAPARRATMIDVANEARVSQTTVSLVLNHADGARLSAETRERVMKAAAKLNYQPVRRGGAPGSAAGASIGFICDEISTDPWTAIGLDGVREKAWERGLTVMVMATRGDADMESAALAQLTAQPLVGLIYATINTRLVDTPVTPPTLPTVLLNCHVANGALASVVPGEAAGGHAATDVLICAGHRRIGYINGEASMEASRQRFRGYRQALATADLPFDPDLVREGNWQPLSGYEAARALMNRERAPTAIFCANDLMAVGCYEALHELGLRIPDDVAVMGYDDREIAQHLHPPLTTVLLPHFEMGSIAAEMLLDAAAGSTTRPRQIKVECPIVKRGSV
ncbi:MAG TPA: LacI family DNA-binding transcriptional regulator [Roseiarcus sp.]|jgi:LacI family transcriptional regulator|nr:LacI family DNA-binding transcriptional regulator [Roseiarcus sp.]